MKILQLCLKPPYPPVDGGTLAMNSITQGLLTLGHQVKVLSVCSDKHPVRYGDIDDAYQSATNFEAIHIDLSIHPLDAALALLCGESYNIKRFESKEFEKRLAEILQEQDFDIVHFESLFLTPYLDCVRKHSKATAVLRAHNVEHLIWRQMALSERNPLKRWYLKKLALALRMYEIENINRFDGIACITANDADTFRKLCCHKPIADIPFGITSIPVEEVEPDIQSLFHIGSMDWKPNEDAIRWFLAEVWPAVHKAMPQLQFLVAGRKMPSDLMELSQEGVRVVGEVDNAAHFMASKQINVVPLRAGSGIRVKIIEAMSIGKTVITTTVGAQGIEYTDGKELIIADTPEQFVSAIKHCVDDPDYCRQVGRNAKELIASRYSNSSLSQRLVDFYNKIAKRSLS